jgi:hypothetical protein
MKNRYPHPTIPGKLISRQALHQQRKHSLGKCHICAGKICELSKWLCMDHYMSNGVTARERARKKLGCKRRNTGKIYRLENERSK